MSRLEQWHHGRVAGGEPSGHVPAGAGHVRDIERVDRDTDGDEHQRGHEWRTNEGAVIDEAYPHASNDQTAAGEHDEVESSPVRHLRDRAKLCGTVAGEHRVQQRANAMQRGAGKERDGENYRQRRHNGPMNTPRREERRQSSREVIDLLGRVCVVTGATRGLGLATATALAGMGATVVMLGRDRDRGERALQRVQQSAAPGSEVSFVLLDLASLGSVCAAAAEIASSHDAVHVLVNNAGINLRERAESVDGFEMTWAVNHLGPFLFTNQLLPQLRAAGRARVVTVTSRFAMLGRVNPAEMGTVRASSGLRAYCDTKLANMVFTMELARRMQNAGVTATCVHPGIVATDLMRDWPGWIRKTWEWSLRTPDDGAAPIVRLAASESVSGVTGCYFVRNRRASFPLRARAPGLATELWERSEVLVGVK